VARISELMMFACFFAVWTIISVGSTQTLAQEDVGAALTRAERLYYDAQFEQTITLLSPINASLQSQSLLPDEKIRVKVLLALAYIGLNDNAKAKSLFKEVSGLDADYSLSSDKFSPNVIALFDDAKAEQTEEGCREICQMVNRSLDAHDLPAVLENVKSGSDACTCLKAAALDAAELAYTEGVKSFQENDFRDSLAKFHTALELNPVHQLARQYLDFTTAKLRLNADATLLEWRKNIDARQFALAIVNYRQLQGSNLEGIADSQLNQMRAAYRTLLSPSIEGWKRACEAGDSTTMRNLWTQATDVLPDPDLAETILDDMKCAKKFCVWTDTALAMTHLVTRVEPAIPAGVRRAIEASVPTTVYAHVKIDENGAVNVIETQGIHAGLRDAVRTAVAQWKFAPADKGNPQGCTETILPIVISR
jgi:tetratricopeptide (TPR) repeat protein